AYSNKDKKHNKKIASLIKKYNIGGLTFFQGGPVRQAQLTNYYQGISQTPLLILQDAEWGLGMRLDSTYSFPYQLTMGAMDNDSLVYAAASEIAGQLKRIGVHVNLAPVVDINNNPHNPVINYRSFGENRYNVASKGLAYMHGLQDHGIIATAKHFPGHGDTDLDSHSVLPTIEGDLKRLKKVELYPFKKAIEAGVQAIMTAHLRLPALDPTPDLPATLSQPILTGLLRNKLGFKGIIVTDAMNMGGITTLYSPVEAAMRAVEAGVDMILLPPEPKKIIEALVCAVRNGQISEARIDVSVKRILEAKARLGLLRNKLVKVETLCEKLASKEHLQQAAKTFESSMTLVKNEKMALPLSGQDQKIAVFSLSSDPGGYFAGRTFIQEFEKRCPESIIFYADAFTGQEFIQEAVEKARDADVILFALFSRLYARKGSVELDLKHIQMINESIALKKPVVVVSFGSPYFLRHFPEVDTYLCAYRHALEAQKAAVKAIFGEIDIKGKLPVSLPELYPIGHGLELLKKSGSSPI
ncbi:MAG: glycoside hydrolase family 3 C-terminal domain-containing protein, partial [Candidatus Aminicenantes bacterium]|nr:glycoside hydrolase family 3 C-terminal domain-containing protein [Candidatus Aminicenantes bacterium]